MTGTVMPDIIEDTLDSINGLTSFEPSKSFELSP